MTLEERVGQMFMVTLWGPTLSTSSRRFIATYAPGGVVLFGSNAGQPWSVAALTNDIQQSAAASGAGIPMFIAIDQEGGITARLVPDDGYTGFPVSQVITATGTPATAYAIGQALAEELRAVGVNMNLAPVADLETNRDNPVIARRAFGSDPEQVAAMIAAFVAGTQDAGVIATAKHFPGHGDTTQDSHTTLPVVTHPLERLRDVELVPFAAAIDADVGAVMVAHIWFPELEPIERRPASLSSSIVTGLLREGMGYTGLIVTDAIGMDAIDRNYGYGEASILAIQAGVDLIAFGTVGMKAQQATIEAVVEAVRAGDISEARIDASTRRILEAKARFGLFDRAPIDPDVAAETLNVEAHRRLVNDMFLHAVTLVKDAYALLPLTAEKTNLLVFFDVYGDVAYDCKRRLPGLRSMSIPFRPGAEVRARILDAVQWVDTVVVFTDNAIDTPEQAALVNALPPDKTVVVALRSPYDLLAFPDVGAYLVIYTPLPAARAVICDLLMGDVTPSGVLPVTLEGLYAAGDGLQGFTPRP